MIRLDHDRLLAGAVQEILDADQSGGGRHPEAGWAVGPGGAMVYQLGDAFLRAVARVEGGAPLRSSEASRPARPHR